MATFPAREFFASQFEEDGESYLFRMESNGPAVRVSEEERQAFIGSYNRYFLRVNLITMAVMFALFGLTVFLSEEEHKDYFKVFLVGAAVFVVASISFSRRAFSAPRRALRGRETVVERTLPDMRSQS